jgi:xanthine dehydrogenase/oxidase
LHKFYLYSVGELRKDVEALTSTLSSQLPPAPIIPSDEECGAETGFVNAPKPSIGGSQSYPTPKVAMGLEVTHLSYSASGQRKDAAEANKKSKDGVGTSATHASGPLHCSGEAEYADDIPAPENLLHGSLILAAKCHVKLLTIDLEPAMQIPGVAGAFTYKDIVKLGGDNRMGPILLDDVAFLPVGETVEFVGQVLGIVVAASQEIAAKGARAVAVEYSDELGGKAIVSIEDAIDAKSFWADSIHEMHRGGDVEAILQQSEVDGQRLVVVEGSMRSGGQEHFYLEPNSTLAIPSESATNLTIFASTQAPTKTQDFCARVTNTPAAKVVVRMKRMGGGFGGKETRSVFSSVAAALAAKLTNRPVRLTLDRDTDMSITGGRHAFLASYKAGAVIDECGTVKLHALDVRLFNNGGSKFDLTGPVLDRALFHVDNCYYWPNFHSVGTPCKTSQPPHTAFRGFGGPQGMVVCEHIMDHLALACDISVDKLRRDNLYTLDDSTPFGMRFGGDFTGKWNIPRMWDQLYTELDVPRRREAAAEFNSMNKWKKRGVGLIPTKFGIAFTAKFMNQGGALVHLYTDGTVLVSHGGTEMGQGLHTKVCQVAAQAFGIPLTQVYVNDSSTDKVANTLPSAASMSTDLYGMAVLDACQQILKRMQPIRDSLPPCSTLADVAKKAFYERVDMSAHGFFALDNDRCGYDWNKDKPEAYPANLPENSWKGHPFNYFTQGVALAEVEIDVLTGDHKTIRADVLVDVGSSINPAIDIGQIEGAFIQGMGWCTIEEVIYADDDHTWIRPRAKVFTQGPGTYKIPAFNDVPEQFNVALLEGADNPFAVHSSKAVGEPPFFLGCSVFYAIKDAVAAARGGSEYFEFRMPATSERIRMACGDKISLDCIANTNGSSFQPKGSY